MIQGTHATIELKIRSMEHAIIQGFTLYEGKLNEEIKDLVHSVIAGFDFNGELEKELRYEVSNTLKTMCREAIQSKVRLLLAERIEKAMEALNVSL
jgi:hypothetical protein